MCDGAKTRCPHSRTWLIETCRPSVCTTPMSLVRSVLGRWVEPPPPPPTHTHSHLPRRPSWLCIGNLSNVEAGTNSEEERMMTWPESLFFFFDVPTWWNERVWVSPKSKTGKRTMMIRLGSIPYNWYHCKMDWNFEIDPRSIMSCRGSTVRSQHSRDNACYTQKHRKKRHASTRDRKLCQSGAEGKTEERIQ